MDEKRDTIAELDLLGPDRDVLDLQSYPHSLSLNAFQNKAEQVHILDSTAADIVINQWINDFIKQDTNLYRNFSPTTKLKYIPRAVFSVEPIDIHTKEGQDRIVSLLKGFQVVVAKDPIHNTLSAFWCARNGYVTQSTREMDASPEMNAYERSESQPIHESKFFICTHEQNETTLRLFGSINILVNPNEKEHSIPNARTRAHESTLARPSNSNNSNNQPMPKLSHIAYHSKKQLMVTFCKRFTAAVHAHAGVHSMAQIYFDWIMKHFDDESYQTLCAFLNEIAEKQILDIKDMQVLFTHPTNIEDMRFFLDRVSIYKDKLPANSSGHLSVLFDKNTSDLCLRTIWSQRVFRNPSNENRTSIEVDYLKLLLTIDSNEDLKYFRTLFVGCFERQDSLFSHVRADSPELTQNQLRIKQEMERIAQMHNALPNPDTSFSPGYLEQFELLNTIHPNNMSSRQQKQFYKKSFEILDREMTRIHKDPNYQPRFFLSEDSQTNPASTAPSSIAMPPFPLPNFNEEPDNLLLTQLFGQIRRPAENTNIANENGRVSGKGPG